MNNSAKQIALCRVSLQLNSQSIQRQNPQQNRASLCYSANLKKRTDVLSAQRQGMCEYLQKTQNNQDKHTGSFKNLSPPFYPQKKHGHLYSGSKSVYHKNQPVQSIKSIQQIKIQAKRYQNKDKLSKQKKIKDQVLNQYGTITSQVFQENQSKSNHQVDANQFIKTCPDFGLLNLQINSIKGSSNRNKSIGKNKTQSMPLNNLISSRQKGHSNKFILKQSNYSKRRLTQTVVNMKDIQNKLDLFPSKRQVLNRVQTAPNSSSTFQQDLKQPSIRIFQNPYQKQIYKTSNINLSDHFSNIHERGVFPVCKKMTMSSVNKYYELCIQQIKSRGIKKTKQIQQLSPNGKQSSQNKNDDILKSKTMQLKQQLKGLQSLQNTQKIKVTKKSSQVQNIQKRQNNINSKSYNVAAPNNWTKKQSKNGSNNQINKQKSIVSPVIHGDYRPLLTATKLTKCQKNDGKYILLDVQQSLDKDQSLYYVKCSKKQLIDRVSLMDPYKKNVFTLINKGNTNRMNGYGMEKTQQNNQLYPPDSPTKLLKVTKSKSSSPKKIQFNLMEEGPLGAWDLQQNADQHFPNQQFNIEEIN